MLSRNFQGAALWVTVALVASRTAQATIEPSASNAGLSAGRALALLAALMALSGVAFGALALTSRVEDSAGREKARFRATLALIAGALALGLSSLVLARASGGVGTGGGVGGAYVALAVGVLGVALGGLTFTRSRSH